MERIKQLESLTENWLTPFPHLPDGFRKWLAINMWWLVVLVSFCMAVSAIVTLGQLLGYLSYMGNIPSYMSIYNSSQYPIGWILSTILALIYFSVVTVLYAKAATSLKEHLRHGWDILFIVLVIGAARMFLDAVFTFNIFGFVFAILFELIGVMIAAYFLFEIRSYFVKLGRVGLIAKK
jgi:hypothetical protein